MHRSLFLLVLLNTPLAYSLAQNASQAYKVLAPISQADTFQASFVYTNGDLHEEEQEAVPGKVLVKGNKYRLTLGEQLIIHDGETVWIYLPEANEVQISNYDPEQEPLNPAQLLHIYQQGFLPIALRAQTINNHHCDVVDLIAADQESWIAKISLAVERKTKHLKRLAALDSNQTWHTFSITKFEPDVELDDTCFVFNPACYDAIEIIDLR